MIKFPSYFIKLSACYLFVGNTLASCSNFSSSLNMMNETGTELSSRSQASEKGLNGRQNANLDHVKGSNSAKWVLGTIFGCGAIASIACNIWQATENNRLNDELDAKHLQNLLLNTKLNLIDEELTILESTSAAFFLGDNNITGNNNEYNYTNISEIAMNSSLPAFYSSFTAGMTEILNNCEQQSSSAQLYCNTTANQMYSQFQNNITSIRNQCQESVNTLTANYNALSNSIQNSNIACNSGYYLGANNLCNQCTITNCATCANFSTTIATMQCSTCDSGYCSSGTTCIQTLLTNCNTCSDATTCTTCS